MTTTTVQNWLGALYDDSTVGGIVLLNHFKMQSEFNRGIMKQYPSLQDADNHTFAFEQGKLGTIITNLVYNPSKIIIICYVYDNHNFANPEYFEKGFNEIVKFGESFKKSVDDFINSIENNKDLIESFKRKTITESGKCVIKLPDELKDTYNSLVSSVDLSKNIFNGFTILS